MRWLEFCLKFYMDKNMTSFSRLYYNFWTSYNNSEVTGIGLEGQLLALYLQSNIHCNAFGAYYLPLSYISNDLRLPVEQIQASLDKLNKINYCKYDTKTQYIWVCNLAFEQIGRVIKPKDKRITSFRATWKSLPLTFEFLEEIYQKYHKAFCLESHFNEISQTCGVNEAIPKTNLGLFRFFPKTLFSSNK